MEEPVISNIAGKPWNDKTVSVIALLALGLEPAIVTTLKLIYV